MPKRLTHRVTIKQLVTGTDDYNKPEQSYSDYITVSADRRDVSNYEKLKAQEIGSELNTRFRVRLSPETLSISVKDLLALESENTYEIVKIREVAETRNRLLEFDCDTRYDK